MAEFPLLKIVGRFILGCIICVEALVTRVASACELTE